MILTFNVLKPMDKNPKGAFFQTPNMYQLQTCMLLCHGFFSVPYSKWKRDDFFSVQNSLYYYYFSSSTCFVIVYPHRIISLNLVPPCNAGFLVWIVSGLCISLELPLWAWYALSIGLRVLFIKTMCLSYWVPNCNPFVLVSTNRFTGILYPMWFL